MKRPNVVDPMVPGQTCGSCRYWLKDKATDQYLIDTPQGPQAAPVEELRKQATLAGKLAELANLPQFTAAPCSVDPVWHMQADDHWCGQWQARLAS